MSSVVVVKRECTKDVINEQVRGIIKDQIFSESYLCQHFGLPSGGITKIVHADEDADVPYGKTVTFDLVEGCRKMWTLRGGCTYHLVGTGDLSPPSPTSSRIDKGKVPMEIMELSDDSDDEDDDVRILNVVLASKSSFGERKEDTMGVSDAEGSIDNVPGDAATDEETNGTLKMYRISALESVLAVKGHSEIFRFIRRGDFKTCQRRCLPPSYNGNIIFELPPVSGDVKKGDRVHAMERAKDCYYWTRIVPTSAMVPKREIWEFGKMMCTGSLECRNEKCDYFDREGSRNSTAWNGHYKMSSLHKVNEQVEEGGLLCAFCDERPFCISACPAIMFYMYPNKVLTHIGDREHMSRLAIHQGDHVHLPWKVHSRKSMEKITQLIEKHHSVNPSSTPSRLRNVAIGDLISQFSPESASGLSEEEEKELWESLQVISTPQKFTSLLRSVRKDGRDWKGNGIFDSLRRMQENVIFPFIQRYRVPGQGSEVDFPFIFKMSVKGHGSGVDILRRMLPGENLFGTWVMFDVMKRITSGWLTFSAHVYDHNYRSLCTIFTCELMAEDAASCEIAWRQMIDVARQYGVADVHIHGFMADNAIGGWNAVRKVFFGGIRDPQRERSDAFHWAQSVHRHTREGIREGSHAEHIVLWKKLRDATNVVGAYKISREILAWWKAGNAYPEKLKFLQGWMAWWVVHWTQWGNYIRLSLSAKESALMVNTTGAESMHAAMRKSSATKMMGLIEACEMDQNRAVGQISAYSSYLDGGHCGNGPTLYELAFRAADIVGTPSKFIEATNLWVESSAKFDLGRTGPLAGDVRTRSQKRKGPASANISPQDSHRHDTIHITSPNTRGFWRRNLHSTDFQRMTNGVERGTVSENDRTEIEHEVLHTPVSRPVTRSFCPPCSAPPVLQRVRIQEIDVPKETWHLRRTSGGRYKGPQCNGTCSGRTHRTDCRNHIKMVGYRNDDSTVGVVGIAIDGYSLIRGVAVPSLLWFCPNNLCHRGRPRKSVTGLPNVPSILEVQRGTNLSNKEIHFLTSKGLHFVGQQPVGGPDPEAPLLRIDVNQYVERIRLDDPTYRLKSRNNKRIRQRFHLTPSHLERIQRAETEQMRIILEQDVTEGNAFGKKFCVRCHEEEDNLQTAEYWVQICCFPTCSCDDFWNHHFYRSSFLLCKHLYWVFRTVMRVNIRTNLLIMQPVLTVGELKYLLDGVSEME